MRTVSPTATPSSKRAATCGFRGTPAGRILEAVPDKRCPATRTVPVHSDDTALSELLEQTAEGDLVQLTKDGQLAAVVLSRQAYDELLLALSADARHELADIIEQSRRDVAQAGLDRSVVDEAIAAVRSR